MNLTGKYIFFCFILQVFCFKTFGQNGGLQKDSVNARLRLESIVKSDSALSQSSKFNQEKRLEIADKFSIRNLFGRRKRKLDSLRSAKRHQPALKEKQEIDSLKQSYALKLDSIKSSTRDPLAVKKKSDSLKAIYDKALTKRISFLKKNGVKLPKGAKKLSDRALLATGKTPLLPTAKIPGMGDLPNLNLNLPDANLPKLDVPNANLPKLDVPEFNVPDVTVPQLDQLKKAELPGELGKAKDLVGDITGKGKEAVGLAKDAERLKEEGINSDEATELIEGAVKNAKPLKDVSKQLGEADKFEQLKQLDLANLKNAQSARDQLASKVATDKLLQNEETIKAYMEKMGKKKKKFDEISDMRYVPKIKPNEMKGKPLSERLMPGMLFQIVETGQTKTEKKIVAWFLAPELLYRFSGKISAGASIVYRFQYTMSPKIIWDQPMYGYKLIGQVKTWKNFYVRTEWENLSFYFPSATIDGQKRIWQNNVLAGGGRVQPISERLSGYFWVFYNVTRDPHDVFKNRVILKTGLQFAIVSSHKKLVKHVGDKMKSQREFLKQQNSRLKSVITE